MVFLQVTVIIANVLEEIKFCRKHKPQKLNAKKNIYFKEWAFSISLKDAWVKAIADDGLKWTSV
jgi:hypothetical protein